VLFVSAVSAIRATTSFADLKVIYRNPSNVRLFLRSLMLWAIFVILLVMWALGLGFGVGGNLIHILLVVALVVLIVNLIQGRRVV